MIPAELLRKKRDGGELHAEEIAFFIRGVVDGTITDAQSAAFLMASCTRGLSARETSDLTLAMRDSGTHYNFRSLNKPCIDKHSTGGVGDKLSLLIVPLAAACGVCVPMMSGRGLGHTGGTVDKLESVVGFSMDWSENHLIRFLRNNNCFMIKPSKSITPADGILYALRDVTGTIESAGLITASILSKKLVEDLDGLVIDMKVGRGAFMQTLDEARLLAESMMKVAQLVGLRMTILFTNMDTPLGRCVGNWIEMEECDNALLDYNSASADLRELSITLASRMLRLADTSLSGEKALDQIIAAWKSKKAYKYFHRMIESQGGDWGRTQEKYQATSKEFVRAHCNGVITGFKTRELGLAGIELGAGRKSENDEIDYSAGFTLRATVGNEVRKGDVLITVQARDASKFRTTLPLLEDLVEIGEDAPEPRRLILDEWST